MSEDVMTQAPVAPLVSPPTPRPLPGREETAVLRWGRLKLDPGSYEVTVGSAEFDLPLKEFQLLAALMQAGGQAVPYGRLLDAAWGSGQGTTERLRVHICRLRRLLRAHQADCIDNVHSIGYRLRHRRVTGTRARTGRTEAFTGD